MKKKNRIQVEGEEDWNREKPAIALNKTVRDESAENQRLGSQRTRQKNPTRQR